jgi:hypothetical protein
MSFAAVVERPGYRLKITPQGLLHVEVGNQVVIDRGGLHEFIDLRAWHGEVVDGQPTEPGAKANRSDHYRDRWHWIQTSSKSVLIEKRGGHLVISGCLQTPGRGENAPGAGMCFTTRIRCYNPYIRIDVDRRYISDYAAVGDNSICFLSPASFAQRFLARGTRYATRSDGEPAWQYLKEPGEPVETRIPRRLRTELLPSGRAWALLMGERAGFGLVVIKAAGRHEGGELRCTRPRPPAEEKFDEIEFQWGRGSVQEGDTEWGSFALIPGRSAAAIVKIANKFLGGPKT